MYKKLPCHWCYILKVHLFSVLEYHNGKCTRNYHVTDVTYCRFTYFRSWSIITGNVQEITMSLMLQPKIGEPTVCNISDMVISCTFPVMILQDEITIYHCIIFKWTKCESIFYINTSTLKAIKALKIRNFQAIVTFMLFWKQ
jgi:hypothetical protein